MLEVALVVIGSELSLLLRLTFDISTQIRCWYLKPVRFLGELAQEPSDSLRAFIIDQERFTDFWACRDFRFFIFIESGQAGGGQGIVTFH